MSAGLSAVPRRAGVVFSGQGAHRKGMAMEFLTNPGTGAPTAVWRRWQAAQERLHDKHGFDITSIVRDAPTVVDVRGVPVTRADGVLGWTYFTQPAMVVAHAAMHAALAERHPTLATAGAVDSSAAHSGSAVGCVAGHSLGELSALVALGVLPLDVAADVAYSRGCAMERCLTKGSEFRPSYKMYAVAPARAGGLDLGDVAAFVAAVARDADHAAGPHELLEIANYNGAAQVVVAGSTRALAALGKFLNPQWRESALEVVGAAAPAAAGSAGSVLRRNGAPAGAPPDPAVADAVVTLALGAVAIDNVHGVPAVPSAGPYVPHVSGSNLTGRRFAAFHEQSLSPDGTTSPPELLSALANDGAGRSGLQRKSWFMPLSVDVPFHSTVLASGVEEMLRLMLDALPSSELIAARIAGLASPPAVVSGLPPLPAFVCNLTGTRFDGSAGFGARVRAAAARPPVGFCPRPGSGAAHITDATTGRVSLTLGDAAQAALAAATVGGGVGDARLLLATVLALQFARPVQWGRCMESIALGSSAPDSRNEGGDIGAAWEGCSTVVEVSPVPTLADMFRNSLGGGAAPAVANAWAFPKDAAHIARAGW